MKVYYDLHIHSCLSACGDDLQTPNNILNMASLKGLNLISVTDHNTLKHLPTFALIVESFNFLFLYGCEITVQEGFHILAYFEKLDTALVFDKYIEDNTEKRPFISKFNRQVLCNEYDEEIEEIEYEVNVPIEKNCCEVIEKIHQLGGLAIAAHINRSHGILQKYEDILSFPFDAVEINEESIITKASTQLYLDKFPVLYNSDAHSLEMINEAINYIELDSLTFSSFKKYLEVLKNE